MRRTGCHGNEERPGGSVCSAEESCSLIYRHSSVPATHANKYVYTVLLCHEEYLKTLCPKFKYFSNFKMTFKRNWTIYMRLKLNKTGDLSFEENVYGVEHSGNVYRVDEGLLHCGVEELSSQLQDITHVYTIVCPDLLQL